MLSTRRRSLAAVAAAVLVLTPLSACGSDDEEPASADSSTSPSTSSDTGDATGTGDSGDGGDSADSGSDEPAGSGDTLDIDNFVATMSKAMREKKTAHMVMDLGSSVSVEGDIRYTADKVSMKMDMSMGDQKATMILIDDAIYMQQGAGGKYLKIDKSTAGVGEMLDQMENFGPEGSIKAMKDGLQKVELVGKETIDGEELTHYKISIDSTAVSEQLGNTGADATAGLPQEISYDLYVDDDNLMRQVNMSVAGQTINLKVSDWGKKVDIKAPPKAQVQSLG